MAVPGSDKLRTLTTLEGGMAMVGSQNGGNDLDLDAQIAATWHD